MGPESTERRSVFRRAAAGSAAASSGTAMATRAQPAAQAPVRAKGVRASVFNKNTLTSSGLAALDSALGGGIALGTVLCVIEDSPSECHALLVKHFLAQGLVHGHATALCSAEDDLIRALPEPIQPGEGGAEASETRPSSSASSRNARAYSRGGEEKPKEDHLKIAWRYKDSLSVAERQAASPSSSVAADYCLRFDLSRTHDASEASAAEQADQAAAGVRHIPLLNLESPSSPCGARKAWHEIAALIDSHAASRAASDLPEGGARQAAEDKICRIALASLGGPMWWSNPSFRTGSMIGDGVLRARSQGAHERQGLRDTLCFMHMLKGRVRGSNCVVCVTIPHSLAAAPEGQRMLRTADYVIRLDSMHK
jgi:hypothetical protein